MDNSSSSSHSLRSIIGFVRQRFKNRPDTEHEQALLRLVFGVVAFSYLFIAALWDGEIYPQEWKYLYVCLLVIPLSLAVLLGILINPGSSPVRRFIGMEIGRASCRERV